MAYNKALSKENGVTPTYWKVSGYNIGIVAKRASFFIAGYLTQEDRETGKQPIYLIQYNIYDSVKFDEIFSTSEMDKLSNNPVKAIYKYAKENIEGFQDATDI